MPKLLFSEREHPEQTYDDAFLVPNNPIVDRLYDTASREEIDALNSLHQAAVLARKASRKYIRKHRGLANKELQDRALAEHVAFRDCVMELAIKYPELAKAMSRDDVDFHPADGFGNTPVVVANMNNVAGKRMAEATAMMGASAAIPQDKENSEMEEIAGYLHSRDVRYMTPVVIGERTKVHELRKFIDKRDIKTAIVTENGEPDGKFIGLVKLQEDGEGAGDSGVVPKGINDDLPIAEFIRREGAVTGNDALSHEQALKYMESQRVHFLPILSEDGRVKGVLTRKMAAMQWRYRPHTDEKNGGLAMLGTVGALNNDPIDRIKYLMDVGVRGIIFDTAHFDQGIETYRKVHDARQVVGDKMFLVAGNVVTPQAVRDIYSAGANVAKVGIGPGAMCSTRMETGVGRPQLSAVLKTARAAEEMGKHIWADGGIQYPRDVALALAAGASQVMVGSLFAPTYESPPDFQKEGNSLYKENYGMASRQASVLRNRGKLERDMRAIFRDTVGHRAEGVSGAKVFMKEGKESVTDLIHSIMDGVTSAMTYMGARNLPEFSRFAHIGIQTASGYREGKPKMES